MGKKLCIIPARGGSKRIPRKNAKDFLGKPIIAYSIEAALKSKLFDYIMVSTDDEEIAEISKSFGASIPFFRSKKNSSDFATTFEVIEEILEKFQEQNQFFKFCCCIYPCAPQVNSDILISSFKMLDANNYDSLLPIVKYGHPIQRALILDDEGKIKYDKPKNTLIRSQDLNDMFHDAGQFYWMNIKALLKNKSVISQNSGAIVISELQVQDIDSELDWKLAEIKFKLS